MAALTVTLTQEQVAQVIAEADAVVRHGRSNKVEKYGAQRDRQATRLQRNRDGFGGEEAVAKWMGVSRTQRGIVLSGFAPDLDNHVQVRQTTYESGCLILHPEDPPGVYVLAVGALPTFRLAGWLHSSLGRHPAYWRTDVPFPAYFVPQSMLRMMSTLPLPPKADAEPVAVGQIGLFE